MTPEEVPTIRNKIFLYRLCDEVEEHEWEELTNPATGFILLHLCRKCGRTPLEMLEQMPLEERR